MRARFLCAWIPVVRVSGHACENSLISKIKFPEKVQKKQAFSSTGGEVLKRSGWVGQSESTVRYEK
jgi:hypothetical protein